jgi:ABC-2 type transport system ATP-binding protein
MNDVVIETHGLTKRYGDTLAVDGLDLTLQRAEIFGLLGPNGSGKTTTILMLLGLTEPTAGSVRVLGLDPARQPLSVKARVGYMPDEVGFYDELSARLNLTYIARLNGLPDNVAQRRIDDSLARAGLAEVGDHRVGTFSRGMRQRLAVAEVLVKQPQVIILDEPTQGLDPEGAREFLDIVRGLKEQNITVLLSSHLLPQVQAVCDRVGLFRRGRMVLCGTVAELAQQVLGGAYRVHLLADGLGADFTETLRRLPGVVEVAADDAAHYVVSAAGDVRADVARAVVEAGGHLWRLDSETASLDDIYVRYFQEVEHVNAA